MKRLSLIVPFSVSMKFESKLLMTESAQWMYKYQSPYATIQPHVKHAKQKHTSNSYYPNNRFLCF